MPHFQSWMKSFSIKKGDKVLCAVSGGLDSMVMLDLFAKASNHIEVMHMNYQLRGEASDLDQALVENICAKHGIKCHIKSVIKPSNCNTQEWARDERYQFIKELDKLHQYQYLATAHHNQDQLETILMSVFKGYTLQTIKPVRNKIVRPLLGLNKEDIHSYASANDLEFRQDQSNFSNDYDRNFLRNEIIPSLQNRFDNFDKRVLKFAERQTNINRIADLLIDEKINSFSTTEFNNLGDYSYQKIDLNLLKESEGEKLLSINLNKLYSLNEIQLKNLLTSKDPGASIMSQTFYARKDRKHLYIGAIEADENQLKIQLGQIPFQFDNLKLESSAINELSSTQQFSKVNRLKGRLMVDCDQIDFPLTLRKLKKEDKFGAFGLKGQSTLLTKYLKDRGMPAIRRKHEYLLIDASGRIIVPGMEIDYVLKITNSSKTALFIDLQDKTKGSFLDTNED